ncbi:UPF0481 protein At3g47200-like [Corylus avellana]|uniref:UPF0481 protein At3g47200-like n=1 Tax=Corylus avellana TaxID=13451 RepID=UPI001E20C7C2|nr:UPF0481 protein At3g47200-like [Corylus avellana]
MACLDACDCIEIQHVLGSKDVVIDLPLVMEPALWPGCCIYRVPKKLRKVNKEAYTPKFVSIGPFHHGRKELRDMEMYKLRYFKDFLYRTKKCQEDFRNIIAENEVQIRHSYSEGSRLDSKDFVKMILLDAIFMIEVLLRRSGKNDENELFREKKNDYISSQPWLEIGIAHDLILLENQIPFLVLEEIYTFAFNERIQNKKATFLELSLIYFTGENQPWFKIKDVKHLTDLLRYLFYSASDLKETRGEVRKLSCATKLDEAGLKFKPSRNGRLLDIKFKGNKCLKYWPCFNLSWLLACLPCLKRFSHLERMQCILEVPPFEIDDNTEVRFRNLMALEQCHYPFQAYICSYVWLLDDLIDSEKDVDLLADKEVIVNNIGSNTAVATLINKLCLEITLSGSCYSKFQEIHEYLDNPWNRAMATMKSVYFRDFWRGTGSVVGLILLGLTFWNFVKPFVMKKI